AKAAALLLEIEKVEASSVCSVIAPPWMVDGVDVPVIWSILLSSVCTLSVTLSWLPVAPEATKVIVVPSTVIVFPGAKPAGGGAARGRGAAGPAGLWREGRGAGRWVLKKLPPASTADAATSDVLARVEIDEVSAVLKFDAVAAGVAPMVKPPAGGGDWLVAVS